MTTSGTTSFSPTVPDFVVGAYGRLQIRVEQLTQAHLRDFRIEANLLLQSWANRGVNLWSIDQQTLNLTQGTAAYTLPADTISVLDTFVRVTDSSGNSSDYILSPISRTDYASQPNKAQQAQPQTFWINRQEAAPTMTMWPTPDQAYTLYYWRIRQLQDVTLNGNAAPNTVDMPVRFADAFMAGMAYRVAKHWKPELEAQRKADYDEAFGEAAGEDVEESIGMYISPAIGAYYR